VFFGVNKSIVFTFVGPKVNNSVKRQFWGFRSHKTDAEGDPPSAKDLGDNVALVESLTELATALSKAQSEMKGASKDNVNPHYKSRYADLASVWDACRIPLTKNGLSIVQRVRINAEGNSYLETLLLHCSGQYLCSEYPLNPVKNDPQGFGAAITYARRFSLMGMVGICPEDDDGESSRIKILNSGVTEQDVHALSRSTEKYRIPFGKFNGKTLEEIPVKDLLNYCEYIESEAKKKGKDISWQVSDFLHRASLLIGGVSSI